MDLTPGSGVTLVLFLLTLTYRACSDRGDGPLAADNDSSHKFSVQRGLSGLGRRPLGDPFVTRLRRLLDEVPVDHVARPHLQAALATTELQRRGSTAEDRLLVQVAARPGPTGRPGDTGRNGEDVDDARD